MVLILVRPLYIHIEECTNETCHQNDKTISDASFSGASNIRNGRKTDRKMKLMHVSIPDKVYTRLTMFENYPKCHI